MALHGREAEIAQTRGLVGEAREARGTSLLLRGEAGVGKSELLDQTTLWAEAGGLQHRHAAGLEPERQLPFGVVHQLVHRDLELMARLPEPQRRALAAAFGLESPSHSTDRFMVSAAILGLLSEVAADGPLLCTVDDVHWADSESLDALTFIAHRIDAEPIALLFAARPTSSDSPILSATLDLIDLGAESAHALLDELSEGRIAVAVGQRLIEETGGNPLALREAVRELSSEQLSGRAELPAVLPLGEGLERAYAARARRLPERAQVALQIAAVQGEGEMEVAIKAARDLGADTAAFDELEQHGFLVIDGSRFRFRHPLLRSGAYSAAPAGSRRAAHRAVAERLADDPERRALQLAAAAVGPDPEVAASLIAAATRARFRGAPAAASAAAARAAELTADGVERTQLLAQAADDAWMAGQGQRALGLIDRAADIGQVDEGPRRKMTRLRGTIEAWGGQPAQGCEVLCREATELAAVAPSLALELLAEAAEAASFTGDPAVIGRVGAIAAEIDVPIEEPHDLLRHRIVLATSHLACGRIAEAEPLLAEAVALGRNLDDPASLNLAGRAATYIGDAMVSLEIDRRAGELAHEAGAVSTIPSLLIRTALNELRLARLLNAEATASEAIDLADATGQQDLVAAGHAAFAYTMGLRGRQGECRASAEQAIEMAQQRGLTVFGDIARAAQADIELAIGRAEESIDLLERTTHPAAILLSIVDRADAAAKTGRREAASFAAETAHEWGSASGVPIAEAVALHCRAAAAQPTEAAAIYEAALDRHADIEYPFERARTELALGELLRRQRRRDDSRAHLRKALGRFETIGAEAWAQQARDELRATGQSARRRDPSTLDDLTPRELQVGQLVAKGLTSREVAERLFLSPRTIDFHLRNLFRKLGLTTRTQLAQIDLDGHTGT